MDNDFDFMFYEFIKEKPENIRLASQIAECWTNIRLNYFLKSFVEVLEAKVSTALPHAEGWIIANAMARDRWSKYVEFSIGRSSWGGRKVTLSTDGTFLSSLHYGLSKQTKGDATDAKFEVIKERMSGTSDENWEFWLYPTKNEFRNLSSADGLISIGQDRAAIFWAQSLIDLATEVAAVIAASTTPPTWDLPPTLPTSD